MTDKKDIRKKISPSLQAKLDRLREILRGLASVVVGVSGGVDSSLLLALAVETLGKQNVLAVTARGFMHSANETAAARLAAEQVGAELLEVDLAEFSEDSLAKIKLNQPDRCYWCKFLIFSHLASLASQRGYAAVASGSNADDPGDYRPGSRAEVELDIARPLLLAGMTKRDIRDLARAMGLGMWDRPATPCLATRLPYGRELSDAVLRRIERGEADLAELGLAHCRLRDHDTLARLEVPPEQLAQAFELREKIVQTLKARGYTYIALDMEGFRSGAMNETLEKQESEDRSQESEFRSQ